MEEHTSSLLCYVPCSRDVWAEAEIVHTSEELVSKNTIRVRNLQTQVETEVSKKEVKHRNSQDCMRQCTDLIQLVYLNEASILHTIAARYYDDHIYTFNNSILMAVNPYKSLPLYSSNTIEYFETVSLAECQETPHVFCVGKRALHNLRHHSTSQSILVSGESGAGKTQTAKYLMTYISKVSSNRVQSLRDKILASNPILEAFGNAQTMQNHNSSRFGKFIQLGFDEDHQLVGGHLKTYLLESVRITKPKSCLEQNFHIFHLVCESMKPSQFYTAIGLKDTVNYAYMPSKTALNEDKYSHHSAPLTMKQLQKAFEVLNFSQSEIANVFQMVGFILNWGNLCSISSLQDTNVCLQSTCEILSLSVEKVSNYLRYKYITVNGETIQLEHTEQDFQVVRDSTAQKLYRLLFDYLVRRINLALGDHSVSSQFIGILDIFGFEIFSTNEFEQLCINYTNEKLQELFNQYIFTQEQQDYEREKIHWNHIDFPDNRHILHVLEKKQKSVFSFLNEQSILKSGTNAAFYSHVLKSFKDNTTLCIEPSFRARKQFAVRHYAGTVCYTTRNFVEKNRFTLDSRFMSVFSDNKFINQHLLFSAPSKSSQKSRPKQSKTILQAFKKQLHSLTSTVSNTEQHYIRCIKPNNEDRKEFFELPRVYKQLQYCGVLEAVKIARAGYPFRIPVVAFQKQFFSAWYAAGLCDTPSPKTLLSFLEKWINVVGVSLQCTMDIQVGRTKIFLKKYAHDAITVYNRQVQSQRVMKIQRRWHSYRALNLYRKSVHFLKVFVHSYRQYFSKKIQATIRVGAWWRQCYHRSQYATHLHGILRIQSLYRGQKSRRLFYQKQCAKRILLWYRQCVQRRNSAAYKIQAQWKRMLERQSLVTHVRQFISSQNQISVLKQELKRQRQRESDILAMYQTESKWEKELLTLTQIQTQVQQSTMVQKLKQEKQELLTQHNTLKKKVKEQQTLLLSHKTQLEDIMRKRKEDLVHLKAEKQQLQAELQKRERVEEKLALAQKQQNQYVQTQQKKDAILSEKMRLLYLKLNQAQEELKQYRQHSQRSRGLAQTPVQSHSRSRGKSQRTASSRTKTISRVAQVQSSKPVQDDWAIMYGKEYNSAKDGGKCNVM